MCSETQFSDAALARQRSQSRRAQAHLDALCPDDDEEPTCETCGARLEEDCDEDGLRHYCPRPHVHGRNLDVACTMCAPGIGLGGGECECDERWCLDCLCCADHVDSDGRCARCARKAVA